MSHLGWSSRTYPLDAADIVRVPDYDGPALGARDLPADEVVLLIRPDGPDALLRGRSAAERARGGTVDVRVVFVPSIAKWNLPFTLARFLRNRRRYEGTGVYHIATEAVRQMGLERAVRTLDSPQERDGVDRRAKMGKLERSLRARGYDDSRPINVMLCRSRGCEDSLRQGHHRISACLACGIPRMTIHFSAAGALPRPLRRFVSKSPLRLDVLRSSLESHIGRPIGKIVPVEDDATQANYIVVPEQGGRFVVKVVPDESKAQRLSADYGEGPAALSSGNPARIGGRYVMAFEYGRGRSIRPSLALAAGLAPAVMVSLLVGALAIDVAVMRTACGDHSLVAWSQFACAGVAAALMFALAVLERRCRAGYLFWAAVFLAMSLYELLRDVEMVRSHAVGNGLVAATLAAGGLFAVFGRRTFGAGLRRVVASRAFLVLPFSFACIWVVAKVISSRVIWGALTLSEHEIKTVKHIVEEGTELLGYAVLLCGAVFFFAERLAAWRRRRCR
ncbi:MAG: hypothetical protein IJ829_06195 [Kiritimatiellae bacterium]|nr:hypothetical protein [Kiritimatiellia bacterium]